MLFFPSVRAVTDLDDLSWLKAVCSCVDQLTSQPRKLCLFQLSSNLPVSFVAWHVRPAVTRWPCAACREGYRPEPVDWPACTALISLLAVWLPADTCRPVPKPKHKFTFIWKKRERKGTHRTNPVAFSWWNVKVWVPCKILAQMDRRERNSVYLWRSDLKVSQRERVTERTVGCYSTK